MYFAIFTSTTILFMKKLIIIGNGFDLAHGYRTSYRDFMKWLVRSEFFNFWKSNPVGQIELPLFSCSISQRIANMEDFFDENLLKSLFKSLKKNNFSNISYSTSQSIRKSSRSGDGSP